ncbi:MAG: sulfite exporter TauE/SafE family protein [Phycisphaerales bacterium]|nr:sulfite exporter TauE/SafE family protein [Phycisphaerales bacterium]
MLANLDPQIWSYEIWTLELWEIGVLLGIGIIAGLAGGLLGIGGAVVNIPAISLLIGRDIHLAQAAAMNVTFFVALPAAIRHYKEGQLNARLLKLVVPAALLAIIGGVFLSGAISDLWMQRIFGAFLIYVIIVNIIKLLPGRVDYGVGEARITRGRGILLGSIGGGGAGLLGIGGGLLNVPLSQKICRIPLPVAIATSSAIMCFTSIIGAITKDATLPMVPIMIDGTETSVPWYEPFKYSIWLIPTCVFGSWFGAKLTHSLPLKAVRIIFLVVVAAAALKMLW